ncbi:MAG: hypothetical protein F4Z57_03025 [Gemmatimonadetes bacterium]|nr:hypothetical protein [Gemmatimonadota bacterium]
MALKPSYDAESEVPEGLREHYQAGADGKFVLQLDEESVNAGFKVENVSGLSSALQAERDAVRQLKDSLKRFDPIKDLDLSGDQIKSALDENARLKTSESEQVRTLNARLEETRANRDKAIREASTLLEQQRDAAVRILKREMVDNALRNEVIALGGNPKWVLGHLSGQIGTTLDWDNQDSPLKVFVKDINGNPRLKADASPFGLGDLVAENSEDPDFRDAYAQKPTPGPGGRPIQPINRGGAISEEAAMGLSDEDFQKAIKEGRIGR